MAVAHKLFESFDAAPKRLKDGDDFFINEWIGTSLGPEPHIYKSSR